MTSAVYGRMRVGRCVTQSDYVGCWNDALAAFDARCSGRQSCQVQVRSDLWREEEHSCVEYAHGYVEASFECFEGEQIIQNPLKSRKCEIGLLFPSVQSDCIRMQQEGSRHNNQKSLLHNHNSDVILSFPTSRDLQGDSRSNAQRHVVGVRRKCSGECGECDGQSVGKHRAPADARSTQSRDDVSRK